MENISDEAITKVWIICLILGLVVTIVVAVLLIMIRNTARKILGGVQKIWTEGKLVANKIIVKVARKLLIRMFYCLKHQENYIVNYNNQKK